VERLEIMEALKQLPVLVEREVEGLPESVLRYKPSDDDWSIKEILGHLRLGAENWATRMYMIWSQTDPRLAVWDEAEAVRAAHYQDADVKSLISDMREYRVRMVNLLDHAVDWTRLGQLEGVGRRTMKQFAESLIAGEAAHLEEIRGLKQQAQAGSRP
jgi:hypothetical protein